MQAKRKLSIKDRRGRNVEVNVRFFRYDVNDFTGKKMTIPGIMLMETGEYGEEPYATLTKSFGEFIPLKNCAYIDTNNCSFAEQLLEQGIAIDTGLAMHSGYCEYPLWKFDELFLKEIGGVEYEEYSREYDGYMNRGDMGETEEVEELEEVEEPQTQAQTM